MYREQQKRNLTSILTSRPKAIKTLEEAYGVKYQPTATKVGHKSPIKNGSSSTATFKDRGDMDCTDSLSTYRPNYNKYLITASDRYGQPLPTARRRSVTFNQNSASTTMLKESHAEVLSKQEQYFSKTEKTTTMRSVTPKGTKSARSNYAASDDVSSLMGNNNQGTFKNDMTIADDETKKRRNEYHRHHHHQQKHDSHAKERLNEEKDDTEEFIALIRREIEKSVVKSITERMTSTFVDINRKVDRQAAEIRKIGNVVQKLHNSLSNKIAHYGEENSRHFRYLCMKSEYDKMFYQHHNEIVAKSAPVTPPGSSVGSSKANPADMANNKNNCTLPSARTLVPEHQMHSMDRIRKPLDENMRDMVAQLKKFCLQYESTVILEEDFTNKSATSDSSSLQLNNNPYQNCKHLYPDDETVFSSDGMTPRSIENEMTLTDRKHSKHSIKQDTFTSLNNSSLGCGDI